MDLKEYNLRGKPYEHSAMTSKLEKELCSCGQGDEHYPDAVRQLSVRKQNEEHERS